MNPAGLLVNSDFSDHRPFPGWSCAVRAAEHRVGRWFCPAMLLRKRFARLECLGHLLPRVAVTQSSTGDYCPSRKFRTRLRSWELQLIPKLLDSMSAAGNPPRGGLIGPENPRCAATGEYCTPSSDRRPSTLREEAPTLACSRPALVGLAVARVDGLAFAAGHRQARNSRCMAPQGLPRILDVEDSEG